MSWLGDLGKFEGFNLKDMWGKIKKDPERLLLGAADPWSTKMWGKALGKEGEWEPIVDQMGGPYGGSTVSAFGANDGGVYGRAREAGIDTGAGENMNDFAHVIAAFYGGQGLGNVMPGGGQGGGQQMPGGMQGMPSPMQQQPQQPRQRRLFKENEELKEHERRRLMAQAMQKGGMNG